MKKILILLLICGLSHYAHTSVAQQKISKVSKENKKDKDDKKDEDERPVDNGYPYFLANTVYPQDQGVVEVIVAPYYIKTPEERDTYLLPTISYGITDSWQVWFDYIPYYILDQERTDRTQGTGDSDIATQYSWMYINKSNYSAAVVFNLHLATADIERNLTDGFLRLEPSALLTRDIYLDKTCHIQLYSEIGFSFVERMKKHRDPALDEPAAHYFIWHNVVSARTENYNFSIELNWYNNTWNNGGQNDFLYITPEVYFKVGKNVAMGVAAPIGLTKDASNYIIIGNLLVDIPTIFAKPASDKSGDKNTNSHGHDAVFEKYKTAKRTEEATKSKRRYKLL